MKLPTQLPRKLRWMASLLGAIWIAGMIRGVSMSLPDGTSRASPEYRVAELELLTDVTYHRGDVPVIEQQIFDRVLEMIDHADRFVVIDMFLFNDEHLGDRPYRPITNQLTERLLARKQTLGSLDVTFITDEINHFYGAYQSAALRRLEQGGIRVIITDLSELRDSNPAYSSMWRAFLQWFGTGGPTFAPHPLTSNAQRVTVRSYLKLLNFKANHRKVLVTEDGCMVASANPHDASSFHSNIAFVVRGALCGEILAAERAVAAFSGAEIPHHALDGQADVSGTVTVRLVTEGRIRVALLEEIDSTRAGERIDVAMFYLSDRLVVRSLKAAGRRGVIVRVLLDPNKDAFGRQKGGIPNRQVARELTRSSDGIEVRWYDTRGEQFHTKLVAIHTTNGTTVLGGSANLTRRNIGDYNLEADLIIRADDVFAQEVAAYFDRLWFNRGGTYSLSYDAFADDGLFKRVVYRLQEFTGFSSY